MTNYNGIYYYFAKVRAGKKQANLVRITFCLLVICTAVLIGSSQNSFINSISIFFSMGSASIGNRGTTPRFDMPLNSLQPLNKWVRHFD